ncbi:hypothetical protein Tco_1300502 [Tanacetum coccineum]
MSAAESRGYGVDDGLWDAEKPPGETGETTEMEEGRQNFDLAPHMRSRLWIDIDKGIEQHFAKMERSKTHEYPSLILTFYNTYTYEGVWVQYEARIQYEMLRLRDLGANTPSGVPYTKEQILALVRKGKQRGHIPEINETLASRDKKIKEAKDEAKQKRQELNLLRRVVASDDRISQMLRKLG